MKRKLSVLLAMAVTLTLGLALGRWSPWTTPTPRPVLSPSPATDPAPVTLAFLGASTDPWQRELDGILEELCQAWDWDYVSYDCYGDQSVQDRQLGELIRGGGVQLAVVNTGTDKDEERVKALEDSGCRVVTVGRPVEGADGSVTFDETGLAAAAADFFRDASGVLLLPDLAQDPRTEALLTVFAQRGLPILETGATWGDVDFGRDWLAAALDRWPRADGVVVFSRTGALAAAQVLEGREGVESLCLSCSPELEEDVAQGRLSAALSPGLSDAEQALEELLPQVAAGQRPRPVALEFETAK